MLTTTGRKSGEKFVFPLYYGATGDSYKATARTVTGEERAKLWSVALKFWPPYADYAKKTEREIPVVVLDPVE
jgi:hypothetical protein